MVEMPLLRPASLRYAGTTAGRPTYAPRDAVATAGTRETLVFCVQQIHQTTRCGACFAKFVVEMPGVEPGSNVYTEGLYDYVSLSSLGPSERNRERARVMTQLSGARRVSRDPTSLMTPHPLSEDRRRSAVRIESNL